MLICQKWRRAGLKIRHVTTYRHRIVAVTKSSHRIHLCPIHDWKQSVSRYSLSSNAAAGRHRRRAPGEVTEFEDVFGNFAGRFDITTPYTQLQLHAESEVEVLDVDPFDFVC